MVLVAASGKMWVCWAVRTAGSIKGVMTAMILMHGGVIKVLLAKGNRTNKLLLL